MYNYKGTNLTTRMSPQGYLMVYLNGKIIPVHNLVYIESDKNNITEIAKGHVVHHLNLIKTDNRIENLQYMTKSDHRRLHMLGSSNPLCKYVYSIWDCTSKKYLGYKRFNNYFEEKLKYNANSSIQQYISKNKIKEIDWEHGKITLKIKARNWIVTAYRLSRV